MDLGFITHGVHMNARLVELKWSLSNTTGVLTITAPPSGKVYPPGPAWLFVVIDGIPSTSRKVLVGDGSSPLVDRDATEKCASSSIQRFHWLANFSLSVACYDKLKLERHRHHHPILQKEIDSCLAVVRLWT